MLGFKDINAFYKQYSNKSTIEFLEGLLDEFKITIKIDNRTKSPKFPPKNRIIKHTMGVSHSRFHSRCLRGKFIL